MPVRFGKYILLHQLAVGGMAEIHLAKQTGLEGFEKLVVLKKILEEMTEEHEFVEMFVNEARIAARLNHPNIVQIYDLGRVARSYFIAMEYVHGEDLRSISRATQKRGIQLPFEHVCKVMSDVLQGLHFAHTRVDAKGEPLRIVHRDISPQNVIVSYDGTVKIVDFGIAKATVTPKTLAGVIKGKYAYMSPEQCQSKPIDARADVFSVGVILYEFCTGARLFKRDTDFATLKAITDAPVPAPRSIVADLPEALETIIFKALERDPDKRYASAQDMQLELEDFLRKGQYQTGNVAIARLMKDLFSDKLAAQATAVRNSRVDSFEALLMEEANLEPSIITGVPVQDEASGITPAPLVVGSGAIGSTTGMNLRPVPGSTSAALPAPPVVPPIVPATVPPGGLLGEGLLLGPPLLGVKPDDPAADRTQPPAHELDSHALTVLNVGPEPGSAAAEMPADERETAPLGMAQVVSLSSTSTRPADGLGLGGRLGGTGVTGTGVTGTGDTGVGSTGTDVARRADGGLDPGEGGEANGGMPQAGPGASAGAAGLPDGDLASMDTAAPLGPVREPSGASALPAPTRTSLAGIVFFGALALAVLAGLGVLLGKALLGSESIGELIVRTNPPGALIELDGLRMQARTPAQLSAVRTDVDHRLQLSVAGFHPWEQMVRPARKGEPTITVQAELRPKKSALWITSDPPGADVVLDGHPRGKAPILLVEVEPGAHRLELRKDDLGHLDESLKLADGELRQLQVKLARLPPPPARLTLETSSPAEVRLGKRDLGTTPLSRVEVPAGKLELLLRWRVKRRTRQRRIVLEVEAGKDLVHAVDLKRE